MMMISEARQVIEEKKPEQYEVNRPSEDTLGLRIQLSV
jgi:hypothetical protein